MSNLLEQLDVQNSDNQILQRSTRKAINTTTLEFRFPGSLMPDGEDCVAHVEVPLDFGKMQGWTNFVRGEWNARKERQEIAEAKSAAAHRAAEDEKAKRPTYGGSGPVPVEEYPQVGETTVEGFIRAKIAELDRARNWWRDEAAAARLRYDNACKAVSGYDSEIAAASRLLEVLNDAPEVRKKDSLAVHEAEELRQGGDSPSDPVV